MSKFAFAPMFSAAHVSKWESIYENAQIRAAETRTRLGEERISTPGQESNDGEHEGESEGSNLDASIFTRRDCEITVRVAASVGGSGVVRNAAACHCHKSHSDMAIKTYTWVTLWFLLTAPVVLWDATYCFMRPRSMVGGDLHWIWEPYSIYQNIDHLYGVKALEENNGFTNAQSFLNVVETAMNLAYVYLAHVSSWSGAPVIGFAAATMTLSKTVLYWAQEYYCGGCAAGHNTWGDLLLYWVLPNGFWLVFPSMIVWRLGGDIISSLSTASQGIRKATSGKTQ